MELLWKGSGGVEKKGGEGEGHAEVGRRLIRTSPVQRRAYPGKFPQSLECLQYPVTRAIELLQPI
jgi:hypothetical protein